MAIASRGRVRWGLGGTSREGRVFHPADVAATTELRTRQFKCGACQAVSFVRLEDVGTYIDCPFCEMTCTTDRIKSRKVAKLFFGGWLGCFLLSALAIFVLALGTRSDEGHSLLLTVLFGLICLRGWYVYSFLPEGKLFDAFTVYQPTLHESVAGPR